VWFVVVMVDVCRVAQGSVSVRSVVVMVDVCKVAL